MYISLLTVAFTVYHTSEFVELSEATTCFKLGIFEVFVYFISGSHPDFLNGKDG